MSVDQIPLSNEVNLTNGVNPTQGNTLSNADLSESNNNIELIQQNNEETEEVNIEEELKVYQNYLKEYQNYYTSVNLKSKEEPKLIKEDEKFKDCKDFLYILQDPTVPVQVALGKFKNQILAEGENNLEGLLSSYLNQSPNCNELIVTWEICKTTSEATDLDNELVSIFSTILNNIHSSPNHHLGLKLYKIILEKFSKLIQVYLTNNFPKLNRSCFDLLININKYGFSATREVFNTFNLTTKEVMNHAIPSKNSASKPEYRNRLLQLRKSYIGFCLSFFKFGDHEIKLKVLELKDFLIQVFKGLEYDSVQQLKEIFTIFLVEVGANPYLKRITKFRFFNRFLIQQVTNLFSKTQQYALTDGIKTSPAQLAYEFLKEVCSKPGIGICFHDFGYYHPSTFKTDFPVNDPKIVVLNGALLDLLTNLRPVTQPYEQQLSLDILKVCPELVSINWSRKELNLDPKLNSNWLGSITWLQKVINLPLKKWEGSGRTLIKTDLAPPTKNVVDNILPIYFTSKIQLKGLNSDSTLIKYTTLNALVTVLRKFNAVLDSIDVRITKLKVEGKKTNSWEDLKREVSIEVRKRLVQPQPIMQLYFKLQSKKPKETASESQQWLMNQTLLRILRYLYYLIPESLLVEKWQLHKNFPSNFFELPGSSQSLFMSLLNYYPNFIWWRHPNKKGDGFSPLTQLLYLQFTSTNSELKSQSTKLTTKLLTESILFDHNPKEALIWLNSLKAIYDSTLEFIDSSNVFQIIEYGLNQAMTYRFKYLDQLTQKSQTFNSNSDTIQETTLPFSPLLLALEFWYFENLPNLENKEELRTGYFKLITNVLCQLANVTNQLDFIKDYFIDWKSRALATLRDSQVTKLITYWLNGCEKFIDSKLNNSIEIDWESFDGKNLSQANNLSLIELLKTNDIREASFIDNFNTILTTVFSTKDVKIHQLLITFIATKYPYSGKLLNLQNINYWLSRDNEDNFNQNLLKLVSLLPINLTLSITSSDALINIDYLDIIQQSYDAICLNSEYIGSIIINELSNLLTVEFDSMNILTLKNTIQLIDYTILKFPQQCKLELFNNTRLLSLFFDSNWCKLDNECKTLLNSYLIELLISINLINSSELKSTQNSIKNNYGDKLKLSILNWLEVAEINPSAVILTVKALNLLDFKDIQLLAKHLLKKHSQLVKFPLELHHTLIDLISRTLNTDFFESKPERKVQLVKVLKDYLNRISGASTSVLDDYFKLKLIRKLMGYEPTGTTKLNLLKTEDYLSKLKLPYSLLELVISTLYSRDSKLNSYKLQLFITLISTKKGFELVNQNLKHNLKGFTSDLINYSNLDTVLEFATNWLNYYPINIKSTTPSITLKWPEIGVELITSILFKINTLDAGSSAKFDEFFTLANKYSSKLAASNYKPAGIDLEPFNSTTANPRIFYTLNLIFNENTEFKLKTIDNLIGYFSNMTEFVNSGELVPVLSSTVQLLQSQLNFIKFNELESKTTALINILLPLIIKETPNELSDLINILNELVGKDTLTVKNQLDFIFNKLMPKSLDNWQLNWKPSLVNCLRAINQKFKISNIANNVIWDLEMLDRIRTLFSGTSSNDDIFLLKLMSSYESIHDITLQLDSMLIGQSVLKYPKWEVNAMLTAGSLVEISLGQLLHYKLLNLIKHFDPNQPLEDFDYIPNYYQRDEVYDLRFILPLIGSWFYLKKQVNITEFVQKNCLGVLIVSTSSANSQVRQVAYQLLDEFISICQKSQQKTLKEKSQILRIIESLAILVKERDPNLPPPRLPSGIVQFSSQALLVILKPDHPIFLKLSKFLMSPYPFNYQNLPMMDILLENLSTRDESVAIVKWYLTWLQSSFKLNSDFRLINNSNLVTNLISFGLTSRCPPPLKRQILGLLFEFGKVPEILSNLFINGGILNYLQSSINQLSFKLKGVQPSPLILSDLIGNYNTLYHLLLSSKLNLILKSNTLVLVQILNQLSLSLKGLGQIQVQTNNFWQLLNLTLIITKLTQIILELVNNFRLNGTLTDIELIGSQITIAKVNIKKILTNFTSFQATAAHLPPVSNRFKAFKFELNFDLKPLECWETTHYLYGDYNLILKFLDFNWSMF